MSPEYINISKHIIKGRPAIEVEFAGNLDTLASMIYSAMKTDDKFAEVVNTAATHYLHRKLCSATDDSSRLN